MIAKQIPDEQLTPEELIKRKQMEAYHKRESEYSNSFEKNEANGFGYHKTRQPDENTDFSNLKLTKCDWDFTIKTQEYDIYNIPGYPHSVDNEFYFCPKNEIPSAHNLKPFDKNWKPVDWSFEVKELKSWKYKWDEIRTNSGWIGYLYRNNKIFHIVRSNDPNTVWNLLQVSLLKAQEHPLNFIDRKWKESAIGRKVWYHGQPCIIEYVSDYEEVRFKLIADNPEKLIPAPSHWTGDDDTYLCCKKRWDDSYAHGCIVEWDSPNIGWFRNV